MEIHGNSKRFMGIDANLKKLMEITRFFLQVYGWKFIEMYGSSWKFKEAYGN